jgi:uracil-DNA glycosylase family protein
MAKPPLPTAEPFLPPDRSIPAMTEAVQHCQGCPLYLLGGRAVFGEGPPDAPLVLVGEVPGDQEEKQGHPFVGPAGKMLDRCLEEAGVDRSLAYVTNAVKHFKWTRSGKRRLHQKPAVSEIKACKPWLLAELGTLRPRVVVALGSTAAVTLFGAGFKVTQQRGVLVPTDLAPYAFATVHPSSLLRTADPISRQSERERFVEDLARIVPLLAG